MPYIDQKLRDRLNPEIDQLTRVLMAIPEESRDGAVNYSVTRIMLNVYGLHSYAKLVRVLGTLASVGLEFYRRIAAPHEDKKKEEHGDIF